MSSTPTVTTPLLPRRSGGIPDADLERDPQSRDHPADGKDPPPPPTFNPLQRVAICTFSALHILRGLIFVAFPAALIGMSARGGGGSSSHHGQDTTTTAPNHHHHHYYHLLTALLGTRDIVLGGLLAAAFRRRRVPGVHRALAANLLSDAADTFVLIFFAACASAAAQQPRRWRPGSPVAEITAVAVMATLEHITLWSMSTETGVGGLGGFGSSSGGGGGGSGFEKMRASPTSAYEARMQADEDKKRRMDMWLSDMRRAEEMRQPSPLPQMQSQPPPPPPPPK
ncbi:hypothetical protein JDV02_003187 [Purpureocillium takamizusanense]|uniref:Uncharacterized protein n=1 Tax=Purpureocillium takamizusanense TaxID=2060973 RepID=A0A9Q8QD53_9HYPO|nr:uncharacterized protein JDV02_003187 [Purpureocillium takamizusanense]UNI16784.1 hypothetical protein JDV02_003187 [Purpureocillium takamizusanense]